jgi:hypothetical protein
MSKKAMQECEIALPRNLVAGRGQADSEKRA